MKYIFSIQNNMENYVYEIKGMIMLCVAVRLDGEPDKVRRMRKYDNNTNNKRTINP